MRKNRLLVLLVWMLWYFLAFVPMRAMSQAVKPVSLIFDSDMGPDYDDVGAMAIMHALADSGKVKILATVACNQSRYIAGVMSVINTYFNRPDIPVGVINGPRAVNTTAWQKWDSVLVARYPSKIKSNHQAEDAVTLYRKLLSQQSDNSVTIVTVGFFSNLNDLLKSAPDQWSRLSGVDLVKVKVNRLVSMAGRFPGGNEFNVQCDPIAAKFVVEHWPTDIIFSGWEIGAALHTGLPLIKNEAIRQSPIKDAFAIAIPLSKEDTPGRMSWDETAMLVAINGYEPYYTLQKGRMICREWGANSWDYNGRGHYYLVQRMPVTEMEQVLNILMMHQPVQKK